MLTGFTLKSLWGKKYYIWLIDCGGGHVVCFPRESGLACVACRRPSAQEVSRSRGTRLFKSRGAELDLSSVKENSDYFQSACKSSYSSHLHFESPQKMEQSVSNFSLLPSCCCDAGFTSLRVANTSDRVAGVVKQQPCHLTPAET